LNVRDQYDALNKDGAFDHAAMMEKAKVQAGGRPIKDMYRETILYKAVPVVAAWESVKPVAEKNNFQFLTPSNPKISARNTKNANGTEFAEAFKVFESGQKEWFKDDSANGRIIYARSLELTEGCLKCHGDPATSVNGNGTDLLGLPLEGLKVGDVKGAFVFIMPMKDDVVVFETLKKMIFVGTAILVVLAGAFFVFTKVTIVKPMLQTIQRVDFISNETAVASGELSHASQAVADGASQQAAALEETSASMEEMSSMTKSNAENSKGAQGLANETRAAADSSLNSVQEMGAAMDEIAKIIKKVDEIAFQTNILALNAAVEAARAGEAGLGFAVVADEVRNLAQNSANAARDISEKIEQGVRMSVTVQSGLTQIVDKIRKLTELVNQTASATNEQSQGIQQVNMALTQLDRVTQSNAASAEETASAAEELTQQAVALKEAVDALLQMVGGNVSVESSTPARVPQATQHTKPATATKAPPTPHTPIKSASVEPRIRAVEAPKKPVQNLLAGGSSKPSSGGIPMDGDFKDM